MQALAASFIRILDANHNPVGAGFLVSDRLVLTCAHVVTEALGKKDSPQETPDTEVKLDFSHLSPGKVIRARVVFWEPHRADGRGDIAGLELTAEPPSSARPVRLVTADDLWNHPCRAFGFPSGYEMGLWVEGELRDLDAAGWLQFVDPRQTGRFIQRGFSGGPVWDDSLQGVVGMIVAADQIDTAFCIPTERLISSWAVLGEQAIPPCPYRGLFAFRERDAPFFFGRETFVEQLYAAAQRKALIVVSGPSGTGKSSVVFAGLVPRLRAASEWLIADFRPGTDPVEALATALIPLLEPHKTETDQLVEAHKLTEALQQGKVRLSGIIQRIIKKQPASRLLLVVDQFEELYTSCPDPGLRRKFLDGLLEAANQVKDVSIVLTMRADFMGRALDYRSLADALQDADLKLGPMTAEELRQAIEKPAEKTDIRLQDGLVERILDEVGDQSGRLPLLEFALTELWERQSSGKLTHKAYEEIKGIEGALAGYAEQVFAGLDGAQQERVWRVFVQLVNPGAGMEDTRRVATRTDLGDLPWELVKHLADARLVVTDQTPEKGETAEIVHETLIQHWWRLRDWMNANRDFRLWQERLRDNVREWNESQRGGDFLLRGVPLVVAEDWLKKRADDIGEEEREYVQESIRFRKRRRTRTLVIAAIIVVLMGILGGYGWIQKGIADREARRAVSAEVDAISKAELAITAEASARREAVHAATAEAVALDEASRAEKAEALTRAQLLAAQGRLEFEGDPLLGLALAIEGLSLLPDRVPIPGNISAVIREFSSYGRIIKLGDDIQKIYTNSDETMLVIDRGTKPGELRRLSDGKPVTMLTYEVKEAVFGSGSASNYFLVHYSKIHPPELRLTSTGAVVPLSGEIENIFFSSDDTATFFVVDYVDLPGELRRASDAGVFEKLTNQIHNQVIFSKEPNCSYFVIQYIEPFLPTLNHKDNGAIITTLGPGLIEDLYCSPDPSARYFLVDYAEDQRGELYRLDELGGTTSEILDDAIESVSFSPNPGAPYFWLDYMNRPGELRLTSSGEVAFGDIDKVSFPPDPSGSYFVVNRKDRSSELWSVSGTGLITESLAGIVENAYFFTQTKTTTAFFDYTNASGAIRRIPGSEVPLLKGEVNWVYLSPETPYTLIAYQSAAGEVRRGDELEIVETKPLLSKRVESGSISSTSLATYFWIHYPDKQREIWHAGDDFVRLAVLDFPVKDYHFLKTSDRLIVIFSDQRSYLLDLKFLRGMAGEVDTMPLDRLVRLVCTGPLASGLWDETQLDPYLEGRPLGACR